MQPDADERLRATTARAYDVTRVLLEADARLLFGSDTPSDAIYTNPPGLNGRIEMDHWIAETVFLHGRPLRRADLSARTAPR